MNQKPGVFVRNMQAVRMIAISEQHTNVLRKNNTKTLDNKSKF
jgi:hypothetical protein